MTRWLAEYGDDGNVAFRIGRDGETFVAEWIGLATLVARRDGGAELIAAPGADPQDFEKIRRGGSRLLLRHLEGKLAMHGAAVEIDGRAVILLGRSGQGKSTLAAHACAHASATLLADDAVALDREPTGWLVAPLEENHWLDEGARRALDLPLVEGGKAPVRAPRVATRPVPLVAFVDLVFADIATPRLARVEGTIAALAALVPQVVRFVLDEPDAQRHELEVLSDLVATIPVLCLARPRGYDALGATVDLISHLTRTRGTT